MSKFMMKTKNFILFMLIISDFQYIFDILSTFFTFFKCNIWKHRTKRHVIYLFVDFHISNIIKKRQTINNFFIAQNL